MHSSPRSLIHSIWKAAYDPIFYLHHTDVDRLLAIWAQSNPDVWVARREGKEDEGDKKGDDNDSRIGIGIGIGIGGSDERTARVVARRERVVVATSRH